MTAWWFEIEIVEIVTKDKRVSYLCGSGAKLVWNNKNNVYKTVTCMSNDFKLCLDTSKFDDITLQLSQSQNQSQNHFIILITWI